MKDPFSIAKAREEFMRANRAATLRRFWSNLTGQSNSLIPFEDLKQTLGIRAQRYRGVQPVPLDKIIGSLDRSGDFDRAFLPTQRHSRGKWVSVDSAMIEGVTLPPVSLYKVSDAYFVVDGHHRISVARSKGQTFIDAEVIEVQSSVPVTPDLKLEDLDVLGAYRSFLEQTKLDVLRPDQNVSLTMPGDYVKLLDHIRVHKYFAEREASQEQSWEAAVQHWYDQVYLPVVQAIRRGGLLADFPGHTEADLYLWIIEHAYYLSQKMGQSLAPRQVARDFVQRFGRRPHRILGRLARLVGRFVVPDELGAGPRAGSWRADRIESLALPGPDQHLFRDILITLTGAETGWRALAQAAEIARREDSVLNGLHVAPSEDDAAMTHGRQVLDEFVGRCQGLGVRYSTSLVVGEVDEQIIERSNWVDLIVINQRRVHGQWAQRPLGTIFQTVAAQAARPVLAVPGSDVMPLHKALLAYDGSPKSREALFVLRHIVTCWKSAGVILTVAGGRADREALDQAWQYIQEMGDYPIITRYEEGPADEVILRVMEEEQADLLLLGGYGYQPLLKAFLGSTVDTVLRKAWFPVLICR